MKADDAELLGDGLDAIRLAFEVTDKFSAPRPFVEGEVTFQIAGPGVLIGDNPFLLGDSGGAGAVWIKAKPGSTGRINIQALHNDLGEKAAEINIRQSPKSRI